MVNLQANIEKIYDHLYANSSSKTPSAIQEEVGKILHTGLFLEEHCSTKPAFSFNRILAAELLNGNPQQLEDYATFIKSAFKEMNKKWGLYDKQDEIGLRAYDLCYCCVQLNGIVISDKTVDVFGDAVEVFRGEWTKRMSGQFFTDQRVTKLAVDLLEFDPRKGDDLIDICAGTGGFLLAGLNRIQHLFQNSNKKDMTEKEIVDIARDSLKGMELDQEVCTVANSTLQIRLGTSDGKIVSIGDSLSTEKFRNGKSVLQENLHACAATNPPFGTKITIKDPNILKNFELAIKDNRKKLLVPTPPDILFLEQNVKMLIPGRGRLAIVLPYQILSGPQMTYIRQWLLSHTKIIAIIDLPTETFQPYTGTKTSLVVIERRAKPISDLKDIEDYKIFMAVPRWIGHDRRGLPVFKNGTNEILTDFGLIETAFDEFRMGKDPNKVYDNSFIVHYNSIVGDSLLRINSKFWKPIKMSHEFNKQFFKESEWKFVKLKELVNNIFYPGRFKRNYIDYSPSAVPFLGGADINEFVIHTDKWLSHEDSKLEELKVHEGWILITRSGTTGIISSVPAAWEGYAVSEHVIRIVPNPDKIETEYLLAVLQSEYVQKLIAKGIYGSVIDEINPAHLGEIDIPIPKSKKNYEQIIQMLKQAETHRQLGILNYTEALERMNKLLTN